MNKLLTIKEVSEVLRINKESAYNLIHTEKLKAVKSVQNGRMLVRESDLDDFINNLEEIHN